MSPKKKYLNLKNIDNSCWIDAAIVLIANNVKFKKIVENHNESYINKIISDYDSAVAALNDTSDARKALKYSKVILRSLQNKTLNYLKEFLKFKIGEPESAFCALLNLIYHDNSPIKEHLNTTWVWHKQCHNCNESTKSVVTKPIITLAKVKNFNPEKPTSWYTCTCKNDEEMKVEFVEISDCLIFHFENGAGKGKTIPLQFFIKQRKYQLTSLIMYEESEGTDKDHFVTWIRQPFTGKWLECNDLNDTVVFFRNVMPKLKMKNIYMVIYETFDNLAKTKLETFSIEDTIASNIKNIELIDLSDDKNSLLNCSSNVEMKMKSFPLRKSPKQKRVIKSCNRNMHSSNETKTSEDVINSIVKPNMENLSHNKNETSKNKKMSMVNPIENLSSDVNETSKKLGAKPKIKTDEKDLTNANTVKSCDENLHSSNETKTSEDVINSMVKLNKENLCHNKSETAKNKNMSIVDPIENPSSNVNETSKKLEGAKPKIKTDEKDLTSAHTVKSCDGNLHSSNETKTSEDVINSIVKPNKENLSHNKNETTKNKKTSLVDPIENLSSNVNETSKKLEGVKPKIKTEKKLTNAHTVNYNAAENLHKATKVKEKSEQKSAGGINYDREKLAELVDTVCRKTWYAFMAHICKLRMEKAQAGNNSSSSEADIGPDFFSDIISAITERMSEFSLSDDKFNPSTSKGSDKKE